MAIPRVFVSSTFYDLRQVREDLERFIREMGYEPVRNETGAIPYGKDASPETHAYREIELCDIVVSIIGGRFGSESHDEKSYSISQKELKTALDRGIQVFIFIDSNVLAEYSTYQLNKENETKYRFVDDKRIYQFIEEIYKLPRNNPVAKFETSAEIVDYLRTQWAGLFQRFLSEQKRLSELKILEEMNSTAGTLKQLVTYLTEQRSKGDQTIREILLTNHPIFEQLRNLLSVNYRVFFTNYDEMKAWLSNRGFVIEDSDEKDNHKFKNEQKKKVLYVSHKAFDNNKRLKVFTPEEWKQDYVRVAEIAIATISDDPPF